LCVLKKLAIEQKIFGQYLTDLNYKILNLLNSPAFYSKLLSETEKVGDTSEFNLLTGTYVLFHTKKALKEASHLINFIKDIIQDRYSVIRELAQAYYYRANYTPIFQILNYDFATNPGIAFLFGAYIKKREFQSALQLYQKIDLNQINFNQKELKIFAATLVILLDQLLKKNRFQEVEDITRQVIKYLETLKQKQKWEEEFPLDNISDALNNYLAGIYFKRAAQNYTDYNFDQALKIASQASELGSKGGYSLVKKIKRSNLINKWCRVFTSTTLVLAMLYLGMLSFGYQISHGAEGFGRFTGQLFGILSRNISLLPDQEDFDHRRARKKVGMGRFFRTKKKSTTISGNNLEQILPSMSSSFVTDEELDPSQYRVYFIKGDPEFIEDQEERRQKAREELQLCYSHLDKLQEVEEEFTTIMVNLPVDLIKSGMDHIEFDEVPEELKKITRKYPEFIKDNPVRLIASKKRKINRKIQYLESIANY